MKNGLTSYTKETVIERLILDAKGKRQMQIRLSTSPVMAGAGKMLAYNSNHGRRNMI